MSWILVCFATSRYWISVSWPISNQFIFLQIISPNGLRVALNVGFKQIDEENLVFDNNTLDEEEYQLDFQYKGLSEEEFNNCINQLQKLAKQINVIGSKIELGYGKSIEEYTNLTVNERANNIANLKHLFKDIKEDFENGIWVCKSNVSWWEK